MLSKAKIKLINSLSIKKYRKNNGLFVVQGTKGVLELLNSTLKVDQLYCTAYFLDKYQEQLSSLEPIIVTSKELTNIGSFANSEDVLAVVHIPENQSLDVSKSTIVLEGVRDPGNLGTILRIADWYGVTQVLCSSDSADVYNPKVVTSSMGSFSRIKVVYDDVSAYISNSSLETYACVMEGTSVYEAEKSGEINLVLGSESHGVSDEVMSLCKHLVTIPRIGAAESLNVGVAAGIICDNLFRS